MKARLPENEWLRLQALRRYQILDSAAEQEYDDLAQLAAFICGTPVAMVTFVDVDRQWFKARLGTDVQETSRDVAFCAHAILQTDVLVVPDATLDERFSSNPLVTGDPRIRFYAGAPLITPDGFALGTLCALDSIPHQLSTAQKDALRRLAKQTMVHLELRQSYERLKELENLRDSLTDMLVHDMRAPLTSFLGGLGTLRWITDLSPEQEDCLALSEHGGYALLGMINNLLDVSRMESGALSLDRMSVSPGISARQAVKQVAWLAETSGVQLQADIPDTIPDVSADEEKLTRILVNLLGNAIKFTPSGGSVRLDIRPVPGASAVQFIVSDTGEGIPADALDTIFEKFGQVKNRTQGRGPSTGLGLAFCKMMVELHGGQITVQSEPGQGSIFEFTIPEARRASQNTPRRRANRPGPKPSHPL